LDRFQLPFAEPRIGVEDDINANSARGIATCPNPIPDAIEKERNLLREKYPHTKTAIQFEGSSRHIGPVIQLLRHLENAFPCYLAHAWAGMKSPVDRANGNLERLGNLFNAREG